MTPKIGKTYLFDHGGTEPLVIKALLIKQYDFRGYTAKDGSEIPDHTEIWVSDSGTAYYQWNPDKWTLLEEGK